LYAALVPLVVIPLPIGQSIGAVDLLFPFGLFTVLAHVRSRTSAAEVAFVIFVCASLSATVAFVFQDQYPSGVGPLDLFLIVRMYAVYLPLMLVLTWPGLTVSIIRRLTYAFLISGLAACLIGIVLHHAGVQVRDAQQMNWYGRGIEATLRAGGLLGNSGDFGHVSAILGVVAITFVVVYLRKPWFGAGVFLIALYATYISSSRAAMLHLVVATVVMLPIIFGGRRILALLATVVLGVLAALLFLPSFVLSPQVEFTLRRLDILNLTGDSLFYSSDARLTTWDIIGDLLASHPWDGIGYGMMVPFVGRAGDNSFLSIVVETGILAGAAFVALWTVLVIMAVRSPAGPRRYVALAVIVSEIAHMLTIDTHRMWATAPVGLLFVGLALVGARMESAASGGERANNVDSVRLRTRVGMPRV
jgi:O-antigen ligase